MQPLAERAHRERRAQELVRVFQGFVLGARDDADWEQLEARTQRKRKSRGLAAALDTSAVAAVSFHEEALQDRFQVAQPQRLDGSASHEARSVIPRRELERDLDRLAPRRGREQEHMAAGRQSVRHGAVHPLPPRSTALL